MRGLKIINSCDRSPFHPRQRSREQRCLSQIFDELLHESNRLEIVVVAIIKLLFLLREHFHRVKSIFRVSLLESVGKLNLFSCVKKIAAGKFNFHGRSKIHFISYFRVKVVGKRRSEILNGFDISFS